MIFGAHVVLYSKNPAADRSFFHYVLGLTSVDAGDGWLIFALPPAEAAFHPEGPEGEVGVEEVAPESVFEAVRIGAAGYVDETRTRVAEALVGPA